MDTLPIFAFEPEPIGGSCKSARSICEKPNKQRVAIGMAWESHQPRTTPVARRITTERAHQPSNPERNIAAALRLARR
jgi:hypothetical protein